MSDEEIQMAHGRRSVECTFDGVEQRALARRVGFILRTPPRVARRRAPSLSHPRRGGGDKDVSESVDSAGH